jgi:Tn7-like transposition protein D/TniQ
MIGYFPLPYPDEFLYSLCARFQDRVGMSYVGLVDHLLFGKGMEKFMFSFPHRVGHFVSQLLVNTFETAEELIQNHTLLPFFLPFLGQARADDFVSGTEGDGIGLSSSRLLGVGTAIRSCRYCPECAKEDRKRYGEAYWHRIHQLPSLPVCPSHMTHLETSRWIITNRGSNRHYQTAEENIPHECTARKLETNDAFSTLRLWLAEQASWILNHRCKMFEREELVNFYRIQIALQDYDRFDVTRLKRFRRAAEERIPMPWLRELGWPSEGGKRKGRWVHDVVLRGSGSTVQQLLVLWLLKCNIWEMSENIASEIMFEPGPWPCLNPVCKKAQGNVIRAYSLKVASKGFLYGAFGCVCGFSYRRNGPDRAGATRLKPDRILQTGHAWDSRLIQLWANPNVSTRKIGLLLGVTQDRMFDEARRLKLPENESRRSYKCIERHTVYDEIAIRDRHRAAVLDRTAVYPNATRSEILKMCPTAIMFLRRRDAKWLNEHLPSWKSTSGKGRGTAPRSDWQARDVILANRIPESQSEIIRYEGPPVRVSKSRLIKALGFVRGRYPSARLPRLTAAIEDAAETPRMFSLRKLEWLIKERPDLSRRDLIDLALYGRKEWLVDPRVIELLGQPPTDAFVKD